MTKEEKQLLLKDLCARLPYGVKYFRDSWNYEWDQEMSVVEVLEDIDEEGYINYHKVYRVWEITPYLRPMSSMTKEEIDELNSISREFGFEWLDAKTTEERYTASAKMQSRSIDFYNAHHFDYRGLIPMGLALEATEDMYKTE